MKTILKHGNKRQHTTTCTHCGCEFSYEFEDVVNNNNYNGDISLTYHIPYVTCPECGCFVYMYEWIPQTYPYCPTSPYGGPVIYSAQMKEVKSPDAAL